MLASLSIKNYALIKDIRVDFNSGLTIVTGETGAGKSILLDALSLVLGKRADVKVVRDPSEKCIIEAEFHIAYYNLKELFAALDLDYEDQTFLRREILPNGKTRAFVNDTPASLQQLQDLGGFLIDIHSQFDTQSLFSEAYQLEVIDTLAGNESYLQTYNLELKEYQVLSETLKTLEFKKQNLTKDWDYNQFLYEELRQANLSKIDQVALEESYEKLTNSEAIKEVLAQSRQLISEDTIGSLSTLTEIRTQLSKIKTFAKSYEDLWDRINSLHIELADISEEIQDAFENLEAQPELLQEIHERLQNLYRLQQKHQVNSVEALQKIEEDLSAKVADFETIDATISEAKAKKAAVEGSLNELAEKLHYERKKVFPKVKEQLGFYLKDLGMPNAQFVFDLRKVDFFRKDGTDELQLLFNANKGVAAGPIQKIASGGELSRVMLSLKAVIAGFKNLPTIVFDEIDTGVSGEIAHKMALIMVQMSKKGQLISITHLPQIAAKGEHHKKVFKVEGEEKTVTQIKELTAEERIVEIAQMIGGSMVSESALAHAKQLLN
ncbi:MAG: DNA repair protein RecN [Flavobacteriaceae bacterium]